MLSNQFLRFLLTGGFAAAVNIGSRYLFNLVIPFEYAVVAAFLVGVTTGYLLARMYVFEPSGRSRRSEFYRFMAVNVVALGTTWVVSVVLARVIFPTIGFSWYADDIAHIIGVLSPVLTNYFAHRYYSFSKPRQP